MLKPPKIFLDLITKIRTCTPGSGSSSFSFNLGKAGLNASGYLRNTLYNSSTPFFLYIINNVVFTYLNESRTGRVALDYILHTVKGQLKN